MLLTAERIVLDGVAHRDVGLRLDVDGRVQAAGPLRALGRPTHSWPGRIILPGLVDACAAGAQLGPGAAVSAPGGAAVGPIQALAAAAQLGAAQRLDHLRAQLLLRLRRGITTVGVVHLAPGDAPAGSGAHLEAAGPILRAAREVGVRVALLDAVLIAPRRSSAHSAAAATSALAPFAAPSLDAAVARFEALVHHIVSMRDGRLSWALLAPDPEALPIDAVVGLGVRLSHLPRLLQLGAADPAGHVATLAAHHVLDATTAVIAPPGHGSLPAAALAALARTGARLVLPGGTQPQAGPAAHPGAPLHAAWCTEAGTAPRWPSTLAAGTVGSTTALGLRGGSLRPGDWADLCALDLGDAHGPLVAQLRGSREPVPIAASAMAELGHLRVGEAMVAGRLILQDGVHALDAPRAPADRP